MSNSDSYPLLTSGDQTDSSVSFYRRCEQEVDKIEQIERPQKERGTEAFRKLILQDLSDLSVIKREIAKRMREPRDRDGNAQLIYYQKVDLACLNRYVGGGMTVILDYPQIVNMFFKKMGMSPA